MGNIISYLEEYGHLTFAEMPFNEVDALILSQFSYLKLDGLIPKLTDDTESVSFLHLAGHMDEAVVYSDERYEKDNRQLFEAMLRCRRFSTAQFNYYATIIDEHVQTQFCAMMCFLENAFPVVVFRGTDENFVGWKEDFNMAFSKPVPGQQLAILYINQAGMKFFTDFIVCGHSKGGNLAVYGSMNTYPDIRNRIQRIYSFDGPGFRPEILKSEDYDSVAERIEKYIPRSSLVGMLLEEHEDYLVVDSSSVGLLQHNPYTWRVKEASFVGKEEVYRSRRFMNEALNEWILALDDEQLEVFGETLFYILEGCEMKNLVEISQDWKTGINNMIRASKDVDEETKGKIIEIIRQLGVILKENVKESMKENMELLKETVKDNIRGAGQIKESIEDKLKKV